MSSQLNGADELYTAYIQVAPFRNWEAGAFPFTYWINVAYDYDDITTSVVQLEIPPNTHVLRVAHQICEAFDVGTAITCGDGGPTVTGTSNDWIADALGAGTAGTFMTDYTSVYGAAGKYYASGDTIDLFFSGVGTWTQGSGKLYVEVLSYFEDLTDT